MFEFNPFRRGRGLNGRDRSLAEKIDELLGEMKAIETRVSLLEKGYADTEAFPSEGEPVSVKTKREVKKDLRQRGVSLVEAARITGWTESMLRSFLASDQGFGRKSAKAFSALGYNRDYLLTGEGYLRGPVKGEKDENTRKKGRKLSDHRLENYYTGKYHKMLA